MLKTCRPILLALMVTLVAGVPSSVLAQDTVPPDGTSADNNSFADQFFVARRTDPRTKQKSIELLGSGIIWFLLLLSVTSIGLIGTTAMANQRKTILPPALVAQSRRMITEGRYRDLIDVLSHDESYFGRLMHEALKEANHGFSALVRRLEQAADELTMSRLRRIEYLNVLGQVSPMIGLFGTVYGMIMAFQSIVAAGGNADPVLLAGGISTALTTTFWGLVVAIPALSGYAIIRNKIEELTTEATLAAEDVLNQFRPKPAKRSGSEQRAPAGSGS